MFSGLNFTHYSNGNFYEPNAGINVISLGIGLHPYQYLSECPVLPELLKRRTYSKKTVELIVNGGAKALPDDLKNNFFAGSLLLNAVYRPGYKNAYDNSVTAVHTARNGKNDTDGRMRFDETECSGGSSKKQIALWVKTHKEYYPVLISKDGWCN